MLRFTFASDADISGKHKVLRRLRGLSVVLIISCHHIIFILLACCQCRSTANSIYFIHIFSGFRCTFVADECISAKEIASSQNEIQLEMYKLRHVCACKLSISLHAARSAIFRLTALRSAMYTEYVCVVFKRERRFSVMDREYLARDNPADHKPTCMLNL